MKFERLAFIFSFFIVFVAITGAIIYMDNQNETDTFLQVTVEDGDSLWSIANKFEKSTNISKQEFVKWVQDNNDIHSSIIKPGEVVIVPVEKDQYYQVEQLASE